jgi:DNA-directed RNA polymerase subunit RPC12/RpoP
MFTAVHSDRRVGICLGCGRKLTFCGSPFTADIECPKCNYINVFVESQQPMGVRVQDGYGVHRGKH